MVGDGDADDVGGGGWEVFQLRGVSTESAAASLLARKPTGSVGTLWGECVIECVHYTLRLHI